MNWSPVEDLTDDLRITLDMYEEQDNYGLNKRSIRPGKTPLDAIEEDDVTEDMAPDALAELKLESYRRKLGFPKKTVRSQWHDDSEEHDSSVDLEISKIIRNIGIDREPIKNPLNSRTTSKTAIQSETFPVGGVDEVYVTPDHFKFDNVYFYSKPEKEEEPVPVNNDQEGEPVNKKEDNATPTSNEKNECTAHRKTFKEPKFGVAGNQYVSPAQLFAMKARRNR